MSNTHVKNIKLGACKVSFGGVAQGSTNISFTSNSGGKKAIKSVTINPAD